MATSAGRDEERAAELAPVEQEVIGRCRSSMRCRFSRNDLYVRNSNIARREKNSDLAPNERDCSWRKMGARRRAGEKEVEAIA